VFKLVATASGVLLLLGCSGQEWALDSNCEPMGFMAQVESKISGDAFWGKQLNLVGSQIKLIDKIYLRKAQELESISPSFKSELNRKVLEYKIEGASDDFIRQLIKRETDAHISDVKFRANEINEYLPSWYRDIRKCEAELLYRLPKKALRYQKAQSMFFK
jgi:hypothetical protein